MGKITLNPSVMTELPTKWKYQGATAYTSEQLKKPLRLFREEPLEATIQLIVTYGLRRSKVCVHPNGAPIRSAYVTPHFQRKSKEIGFPVIRFHGLRHPAVYTLRKGGCDAKDISKHGWGTATFPPR